MKKILLSLLTLSFVGGAAIGLSGAFFTDSETSTGNTFTAGELALKIDNESYYNGVLQDGGQNPDLTWTFEEWTNQLFFNFDDVKPDDFGEDTISLHAENDYWACMEMQVTKDDDNTCSEPEQTDDPTCNENNPDDDDGELGDTLNFAWWVDDGDNVFEDDETAFLGIAPASSVLNSKVALADSQTNLFDSSGPLLSTETYHIGKAWCLGTLVTDPLPQSSYDSPAADNDGNQIPGQPEDGGFTCDGSALNNVTQTDILMGDITFNVTQSRNNPGFLCEPPPPPQVSCETDANIYAVSSSNNDQGLRKDNSAVLANRSDPSAAFGVPQTSGADSDAGFPTGSFFSLGFPLGGNTASIVFGFAEPFFPNPSGPDLQVFETTGGTYPDEKVKVEASLNPVGPWTLLSASAVRDEGIELGSLTSAQYVRLTDVSPINDFPDDADGYDVDALKAFCTEVED